MTEVEIIKEETRQLKAQAVSSIHELMDHLYTNIQDMATIKLITRSILDRAVEDF